VHKSFGLAVLTLLAACQGVNARPTDAQQMQVQHLAAEVQAAEDVRAIIRLQRAYGYYLDKGMWEDLSQLFTADAVANYPAGIYVGQDSIRQHLFLNVGAVKMGELGLGDGRLSNHMNIQPVVHLDPGGNTAKGRWRELAMFGNLGGAAVWAEGVYELTYRKEGGVWKINTLQYYSGFGAPYQTGWAAPAEKGESSAGRHRELPHPADRERRMDCDGFPAACIAPFHYGNPGTTDSAHAWTIPIDSTSTKHWSATLPELATRLTRLQDEQAVENLQRVYGYYFDRAQWDQIADLFADDGTLEMGQQGVYVGKQHIRRFLDTLGPQGLSDGILNDHIQLQTRVDIAPDGKTAYCRSRELAMTGTYGKSGAWSEGVYENIFVKDQRVWKLRSLHFYPTFITDYDQGWGKSALPAPAASTSVPPDRAPSEVYGIYPKAYVPPYHYRNPVTGKAPHYPGTERGGPAPRIAAAALMPAKGKPETPSVKPTPEELQRQLDRVQAYEELENLESAYGYYLDKNLWNDLANLFSRDGSMELAQRGVYQGQDHVRAFLVKVFGRGKEGPVAGRLGNHLQLQPVIDVAPDGQSARIRIRMLQQMSFGSRASIGAAVYENEAVKEDGVWRFKNDHTYNTLSAGYQGGWAKAASRAMPGPSADPPPDAPPTASFAMFPAVSDIPFHYANPVTGRTEIIPVARSQDPVVLAALAAPIESAGPPAAQASGGASNSPGTSAAAPPGMPPSIATALREIGRKIDGARTTALYAPLFPMTEPYPGVSVTRDIHYGPHERHVLDVFTATDAATATATGANSKARRPVLVFIHGGGFTRGAKHTPGSPFFDNIGVWAAEHGLVGVTINYRLAPEFQWPAGIEDLTRLTTWLRSHVAQYGGDPTRIYLWGHSAGAAHVGDYLANVKQPHIAGAILTSGFYNLGDKVSIWKDYYGSDVSQYPRRSSLPGLLQTRVPLLVTNAELDPESFQAETVGLIEARAKEGRPVATVRLPGHSHISETYAVGSADESLSGPVLDFVNHASAR
jgi:acetyl esterase/lipase/ketosteroid isomerase-like protein